MKLLYVTNSRIPTEKAYGLQTMSMCAALADAGIATTLIVPQRKNSITDDAFAYYGMRQSFAILPVRIIDAIGIGRRFGFLVTRFSYAIALLFSPAFRKQADTVVMTRDHIAGLLLCMRGHRVFYDMHGFPEKYRWAWKFALKRMGGVIGTNQWKLDQCKRLFHINDRQLLLARNGFDADLFKTMPTKEQARLQLGLDQDALIVVYTGHLYDWKGAHILAQTAAMLAGAQVLLVGGTEADVKKYREKYGGDNVHFLGQKPHALIPQYLAAADVLVLPNSKHSKEARYSVYSQFDTSPLKLFEYMASSRPIVASSLPSIREILNSQNAVLTEPDDPKKLAQAIQGILSDPGHARAIARQAHSDAQEYTWEARARRIIKFIKEQI